MKRIMFLILAVMLVITMLSGCGETAESVVTTPEPTEEVVVEEDIPFIDMEGFMPENDYGASLPGIDMTPWVGQIITVKTKGEEYGTDFFVISVDEKYPSKAFCLYLYPKDKENVLPTISGNLFPDIQDGDKIQFAYTSPTLNNPNYDPKSGYNVKYEYSYVDEMCNVWAENSPLYDYMLDTDIGIGDTIEFEDYGVPTYHQAYTSSINRRAYAPSVKELLNIDFLNFDYYEDKEVFWLRTINAPVQWWEDVGATSPYEFAATFLPHGYLYEDYNLPRPGKVYLRSYFDSMEFSREQRPAIACNLYNLTDDMVSRSVYDKEKIEAKVTFDFVDAEGNLFPPEDELFMTMGPACLMQYYDELDAGWRYTSCSPAVLINNSTDLPDNFTSDPLHTKFLGFAVFKITPPDGYISRAGDTIFFPDNGYYQIVIEKVSDIEAGKIVDKDKLIIEDNNLRRYYKMRY